MDDTELRSLLLAYQHGEKSLDAVRQWVTGNIWEANSDEEGLVDHVAIELSHLDSGQSEEDYFRSQVQEMLWLVLNEDVRSDTSMSGTNSDVTMPPNTYDQSPQVIMTEHSFV